MKRKASESIDGNENGSSRKRAAVTLLSKPDQFQDELFHQEVLDEFTKTYSESAPFKHGVIKDLVSPELLRNVRSEIQENLSFTPKETDIYKIYQSGDLANLDGLEDSSLKLLPSLLKVRDALYSSAFRDYLSTITGSGPLSGTKTDMAINIYTPGCHLLCHDDVIGSRRVSYILYLTDPDRPWKPEWGGALRLYPTMTQTADDGKTFKFPSPDYDVSIPPAFNQLSFFAVQPGESFHDVEEVYASLGGDEEARDEVRIRMAISGWYHIPQEGEEGFEDGLEEKLAEKSSLMQLQGKADIFDLPRINVSPPTLGLGSFISTADSAKTSAGEDSLLTEDDLNFLIKYISPMYLTPNTLVSVSHVFGEQFSLTLDAFLSPKFSESLCQFIAIQESQALATETSEIEKATPWMVARPPHKHRFLFQQVRETHKSDLTSQSPLQDLLENLFPSLSFYKWLQLATGQTVSTHNLLARRFRRGKDYTLATGYDEEDSRLEITLAITPSTGWEPNTGAEDKPEVNSGETGWEPDAGTEDKLEESSGEINDGDANETAGEKVEEKTHRSAVEETADSPKETPGSRAEEEAADSPKEKTGGKEEERTGDSPKEKTGGKAERTDEDVEDKACEDTDEKTDKQVEGNSGGSLEERPVALAEDVTGGSADEKAGGSAEQKTGEDTDEKLDGDAEGKPDNDAEEKPVGKMEEKTDKCAEENTDRGVEKKDGEQAKDLANEDVKNKTVESKEVLSDEGVRQLIDEGPDKKTHDGFNKTIDEKPEERIHDRAEETSSESAETKMNTVNDVGGYLMYMANDDVEDEGLDGEGHDQGAEFSSEMTGGRASGFSSSIDNRHVKADPAIYQTSGQGNGDEDGTLFSMPAGWNKLGIVLRDKGVMRFVKYVSQHAKGDRWDICGEYSVVDQDDDEGDEVQVKADEIDENIYNTTEEEKEEETESSDEY